MTPPAGQEIRLRRYPVGSVTPDDFELVAVDLPAPSPGEVLVRNEWTSVDPGMRLRLRPDAPAGYFPAFPIGRAMDGIMTIGRVIASRADGFRDGDLVWHAQGWREYALVEAGLPQLGGLGTLTRLTPGSRPPQQFLGPLGGMGLTAYAGLEILGALTRPGVIWVSAAAGAVGSLAVQIAKLRGNQVVASAGSDAKVGWLRERCGVSAFNYRTGTLAENLHAQAPDGIDYYFDAVGGDHLDAALAHLRRGGRVALCGSVSEYESPPRGPRNLFLAVSKDLTLQGFRGSTHLSLLPRMRDQVAAWLDAGELIYQETVFDGLATAPLALDRMLAGDTVGKTMVRL